MDFQFDNIHETPLKRLTRIDLMEFIKGSNYKIRAISSFFK
jgi:hypothetical protein